MRISPLTIDLYELTMASVYYKCKPKAQASFELSIRSNKRPFYVASGIEEVITYLQDLHFTKEDTNYLKTLGLFDDEFLSYLHSFKFRGDLWAVEEPEIIFACQPILRLTGNLIEVQIVESCLLNIINLATTLATKATRIVLAAQGHKVYDFSLRRTQGIQAGLEMAKQAYVVGLEATSNVNAGFVYDIPLAGTMAHSYIMTFPREIESFLAFVQNFPKQAILLVDTYDVKKGVQAAAKVAKLLKQRGGQLVGIRLDSGDLVQQAYWARDYLDRQGLKEVKILASGDLNEEKITAIIKTKAPIDGFGVGSHMGCSFDMAFTDVVYKLVEVSQIQGKLHPTMKLSQDKISLPGAKDVLRVYDNQGLMKRDYVSLSGEKIKAKHLLRHCISSGQRLYKETSLEDKRRIFKDKLNSLPEALKKLNSNYQYPVIITKKLNQLTKQCQREVKNKIKEKVVFLDIDTQYDFIDPKGNLPVKGADQIIGNIIKLTKLAKANKITIISSLDTHSQNDEEFVKFPSHCIKGTKGQRKLKATMIKSCKTITQEQVYSYDQLKTIANKYQQIILEKNVLNIFANPNALELLEAIYPDHIYVYGVALDYCLKEAVDELIKAGYAITIVKDAIKEISQQEKDKLFFYWQKEGVGFITTQQLMKKGDYA